MDTTRAAALVLKDRTGSYFLLSQETLEQARVPPEHAPEVERFFDEATADDVAGHAFFIGMLVGAAIGGGIMTAAWRYSDAASVPAEPLMVPNIDLSGT